MVSGFGREGFGRCSKPTTGAVSTALERALARLGTLLAAKEGIEQGAVS